MPRYTPEVAVRVLKDNPDIPYENKAYFEAVRDGTLFQYYRDQIQRYRDEYSDEIPQALASRLVNGEETLTQYKCQMTYVIGLCLTLRGAIEDGTIVNRDIQECVFRFLESDISFQVGDPQNEGRITRINQILDIVLTELTMPR